MGMSHCRVCGVLDDVGEVVICEDCADKMLPLSEELKKERERVLKSFESIYRFRQHSINAVCIYASDLDITIESWRKYD
jgi:HD-like signal output (HDOD) protein